MLRHFLVAVSLVLALHAIPLVASAQEDPGALLKQLADLDNKKDVEGIVALFAPDGVIVAPSPDGLDQTKTYTGTDQIREWTKMDVGGDAADDRTELGQITVNGDTATAPFQVFPNDPDLKAAGLEPIVGTAEVVAKNGKIAKFTITLDPEWVKKVEAAMAAMQATPVAEGTPSATGQATGPGKLPNTGEAQDPLPIALLAGLGLLAMGLALRRTRRAA